MIVVLAKSVMIVGIFGLVYCLFMFVRVFVVYKNRAKIIEAIYEYNEDRVSHNDYKNFISYDCMEKFEETERRLWDFGYKRIVSEDVFRKICGYLKQGVGVYERQIHCGRAGRWKSS